MFLAQFRCYKTSVDKFSAALHEGEALRSLLLRPSLAPLRSGFWAFQVEGQMTSHCF